MNENVAFFDFCETLTDFQTADAFVDFVREESQKTRMRRLNKIHSFLWRNRVIYYLEKLFPGHSINKRIKLCQLRGFSRVELEDYAFSYYKNRIRPHFIKPLIEKLIWLQKNNYIIGLVSGGYGIYLHYFVEEFDLDFCISSNVEMKNGICTGKLEGIDCLGENKIVLLKKNYPNIPKHSIAFSDSMSDIPLLKWANKGVVVSRNMHQSWAEENQFEEIIWY